MSCIKNLREIREDRVIINSLMSPEDIFSLGGGPKKVVEIKWDYMGIQYSYKDPKGVLCHVFDNGGKWQFLARKVVKKALD